MAYKPIKLSKQERKDLIALHLRLIEYLTTYEGYAFLCCVGGQYRYHKDKTVPHDILHLYKKNLLNEKPTNRLNKSFYLHKSYDKTYKDCWESWWGSSKDDDYTDEHLNQRILFLKHLNTKLSK